MGWVGWERIGEMKYLYIAEGLFITDIVVMELL